MRVPDITAEAPLFTLNEPLLVAKLMKVEMVWLPLLTFTAGAVPLMLSVPPEPRAIV